MAELAQAIATLNAREMDANEQALASSFPPPAELSRHTQLALLPFIEWTKAQKVRALGCRPTTVAAFVQFQQDQGISRELISARLEAIEQMHWAASLANPVACPVVRKVTGGSTIEAPRSWTREEKFSFHELPIEIQRVVARREDDRERTLRRAQNSYAELKQKLQRQTADAAKDANTESGTTNG